MKIQKYWRLALGLMATLALTIYAGAQAKPEGQQIAKAQVRAAVESNMMLPGQTATFKFVESEMGFETKLVKGVPFSADTVTEFTQTLSNGQHLYRKTTAALYRDSEGRTRREQSIEVMMPYVSSGAALQTIFINDPVAGVSYTLNPEDHTATKTTISISSDPNSPAVISYSSAGDAGVFVKRVEGIQGGVVGGVSGGVAGGIVGGTAGGVTFVAPRAVSGKIDPVSESRTEALPARMIEGVEAVGTRTIDIIPTGAIGNDSPIEIVSERWYSAELGMVVKTVRNDPRSGESVYQLKNIRRSEPAPSLFQVPADYTIKEGGAIRIQAIKKDGNR